MAITSISEFEAILARVTMRIEKELHERGDVAALTDAKRDLQLIAAVTRQGAKLKAMRAKLDAASDVLREQIDDNPLADQLWDLVDYIDYRA